MRYVAIVTGASSGVGQAFVEAFNAGKGGPLSEIWAMGRNEQRLAEVAAACHNVLVRPLSLDLCDEQSLADIESMLEDDDIRVQWLVNSAGFGSFGSFGQIGQKTNASMIQLNCVALVNMISIALPHMGPGSRIINLSSIAGAIPQTQLATYSATKAFVLELSRMLDHELRGTNIHVTAVCPKFMKTRFLDKPGSEGDANAMTRIGFEPVERVVSKALHNSLVGRPVCIPSPDMRMGAAAAKLLPRKALFAIEDLLFRR